MPDWIVPGGDVLDTVQPEAEPTFECPECGQNDHISAQMAAECCPVHICDHCGNEFSSEDEAYDCCRHHCGNCGMEYRSEDEAIDCCMYSCPDCGSRYDYEDEAMNCCGSRFNGILPLLEDVDPYWVEVVDLPNRPVRLCSVEQELVQGGAMVARLLYDIGVADSDSVLNYHTPTSRPGLVHVEEDGSLPADGGEVIFDRFDLSRHSDIGTLSRSLTKIRQLRDSGTGSNRPVKTGFAAGIHVHISAKAVDGTMFGPRDVAALYELWCYAEDMLYSLSASGWNRHRQPSDNYGGYCKPVPKEPNRTSTRDVWNLMRGDRYYGLNFQRLFAAVGRCTCGAATMGDWQSCDCGAFDRGTIEWRVFNSSTLPRTIHAWLLMAHAMTAHAAKHELGTLTPNEYGSSSPTEKRQVLEDLLGVLPLTDGERDVIREAADRSPGL